MVGKYLTWAVFVQFDVDPSENYVASRALRENQVDVWTTWHRYQNEDAEVWSGVLVVQFNLTYLQTQTGYKLRPWPQCTLPVTLPLTARSGVSGGVAVGRY